jgi:hypothetical protein
LFPSVCLTSYLSLFLSFFLSDLLSSLCEGKSESRIFIYPKKKKKKDRYTSAKSTYPFVCNPLSPLFSPFSVTPSPWSLQGRLFPVLGIEIKKGYKFIVLRDAWGLVPNVSSGLLPSSSPLTRSLSSRARSQIRTMSPLPDSVGPHPRYLPLLSSHLFFSLLTLPLCLSFCAVLCGVEWKALRKSSTRSWCVDTQTA